MSPLPTRHLNQCATRWGLLPVLLVVWLAPWLGGSVEFWARAVLFLALAVLLVIYPPNTGLTTRSRLLLGIAALLPLAAFLPTFLTGLPPWRKMLASEHGVVFPATLSAQPWLALDAWWLWLGCLAWVWWLSGQGWTRATRKPLAELFAAGILLLALTSIITFHTRHPLPFWQNERLFGPFPNRNQTADLFALTFVLVAALLHMAWLRHSRLVILWSGGLLVLGYALILNYSRAGLILPVLGLAAYWLISTLSSPSRKKIWIGGALALSGLSLLLAFGGKALARLTPAGAESITADFRWQVFHDTLTMTSQGRFLGVGLGGFEWVFPLFRHFSMVDRRMIHPESDWLWLASEIGWPGAVLILGAAIWAVSQAVRHALRKPHPLRVAGAVCGALFILHGFFDVSAHRPGTFFPALFLFALAWPGEIAPRPAPGWLAKAVAAFLALTALGWLFNGAGTPLWPGPQFLAFQKNAIASAIGAQMPQHALPKVRETLPIAPLDWELYYDRGSGYILQRQDWPQALADFRLACLLEPSSPSVPDIQGTGWLYYRPELAALSWAESLRRLSADPGERARRYERYLVLSKPWPGLRSQVETLAGNDLHLSLVLLAASEDAAFAPALTNFLRQYPDPAQLAPDARQTLFNLWAERGDAAALDTLFKARTFLAAKCPYAQARVLFRMGKMEAACQLLLDHLKAPVIPPMPDLGIDAELRKRLYTGNDLLSGLVLYQREEKAGATDEAILTLRRVRTLKNAPPSIDYFLGAAYARKQLWEKAWEPLAAYARKTETAPATR